MLCGKFDDGSGDAPYTVAGVKALGEMIQTNTALLELDVSQNFLRAEGSNLLADGLVTNGALVSANLLTINGGAEQAQHLATVLKEHATLKSLCGNVGDETVLDMRGEELDVDDAIMLAPELVANGAITSLDLSNNNLAGKSWDISNQKWLFDMTGVKALATALPECK